MKPDYNSLIFIQPNSLSPEFCQSVIKKFEEDDRKAEGITTNGINLSKKVTTDLLISPLDNWKKEDSVFLSALSKAISSYAENFKKQTNHSLFFDNCYYSDGGYLIQKYFFDVENKKTGFFDWHSDFKIDSKGVRILVFMWYLNTVEEGGETEFNTGFKIKPEAGKIVIFPASWYIIHKGNKPLSGDKVICTGWLYAKSK